MFKVRKQNIGLENPVNRILPTTNAEQNKRKTK